MKKILLFASALAGLFLAGSCQRENLEPMESANTVTYTVQVADAVSTKVIGEKVDDVAAVTQLIYEVYRIDENGNESRLYQMEETITNGTATVELELVNNQDFHVLFWAQVPDNGVYNTASLKAVTLSQDLDANAENYAAFAGEDSIEYGVDVLAGRTITLYRPVAQLNIATTPESLKLGEDQNGDNAQTTVSFEKTSVVVEGLSTVYNVATNTVDTDNATFTYEAMPVELSEETLTVNGKSYEYVSMNYIGFAPAVGDQVKVTYTIETKEVGKITNIIDNVPVKPNHRTNIVGNLITSMSDYTITLDEKWAGEQYYGPEFVKEPKYNAETKTYTVVEALELKWVAQQVNTGKKSFKGETVQLAADIDLKNVPWTPIGYGGKHFQGTFEGVALTRAGNDYPTISNLFIENGEYAGLFGTISDGGLLRNFNLNHVRISGSDYLGAVLGQIYTTVDNVTVTDAEITAVPYLLADGVTYDGGAKVGGIAGLVGDSATITNCTVKNSTFKAYRDMGGIVGTTQYNYPTTLTGNSVENLTFIVTEFYTPYNGNDEPGHYAPIRGGKRSNAGDVIKNNTGDDIELHKVLVEATEGGVYDSEEKVYTVTSPAGLAAALQGSGAAGAGNHTIQINGDLDMTGVDWTPIEVDGYNGADIVTVEGNGAIIKGLDGALFAGGFAGGSGIVIKDLTIEDAHMIADNTQGYGAFVNCADSMDEITLINCHLKNSTIITPNDGAAESRIGGLVGWTAGYNNPNDGPVDSYITIQNCSVTGCTLKGAGSIGGICGHAGANAATFTKIENCTVTGNTLVSTDDGNWRVGAIVGTANNGQCEIKNVTVSGNTISQVGKTAEVYQSELYGRFVPSGTGTLTIDGVAISATKPALVNGYTALYSIDGNYYVYNKQGLEELNNFFKANSIANHVWTRSYNIGADIDATGFTWDSVYLVVGNNANDGFVLNGCGHTISNLSINGSMFTGTPNGGNEGTKPGYVKDITIDRATVTGGFDAAVFWANSYGELVYENVTVKNTSVTGDCNTAILLGRTTYEDGKGIDNILFKNCKVEKCSVVANGCAGQDPTGASVFVGRAFGKTNLTFEGNSIDEATTITNNNGLVGGRVYAYTVHIGGNWEGTGACDTFTNWDGLDFELVSDGLLKEKNTTKYYVSSAAGLEKMNDMFSNKTAGSDVVLNLTEDIDFTGKTWTPVDSHADTAFEIAEINGNGHTISNLTINGQAMFTRFAGTDNVVVKNITFDNAKVNSNGSINTSILVGHTYQNVLLDNVDVKNSTITGGYKVAPLIATVYNESTSTITATLKNCDVVNTTVKATSYDFCTTGMVAFVYAGDNDQVAFENCTVSDVKLYAPNVYTAHAAIYTTGSETLFNEAEGVTVSNVTFENI